MRLEKIELMGFKSFADKTEIKLTDGVTGIVGPNGCGKSNVADAIRWVLGEQSAKQLRGSSMQDVIFNGTEKRKSLSYCEVSLYFNNEDGKLFTGLDYQEVIFTRKLYRSGESEYYINKQPARMRDIVDFLHECGVSKEGYTIIGQGKVSEILSSKPEDRRAIFEEAVGIAKTKNKKLESERRLARTKENIIRIIDKTTELERILEPLSHQADKTRTFRALSEELKYHEINTYLYKHDNANATKEKINLKIQGYSDEITQKTNDLFVVQEDYRNHLDDISTADEKMSELHGKILEKSVEAEKIASKANLSNERVNFFRSEIERLQGEITEKLTQINLLSNESNTKRNFVETAEKEINTLTTRLNSVSKELMDLVGKINENEEIVQSYQSKVIESAETLASIMQNKGSLETEKSVMTTQQKETLERVENLLARQKELSLEKSGLERNIQGLEREILKKRDDIKDIELEISQTNKFIADITNSLYRLNSELSALESNYRIYTNLKDSFGGFGVTVKNLLTSAKTDKTLADKIQGVVAQVIHTDEKYEIAIETALGGYTQNIITNTPDDAQWLFKYLKNVNGGRINCLPITSVKARDNGGDVIKSVREKGGIGLATDLVKYDVKYQTIIKFLLGNTLITDNIDSATAIAKKYGFAFKIVTLDGDVISPSGSMSGGSRKQNTTNLLAMDRQLEDTKKSILQKRAEMEKLTKNKESLTVQVNGLVGELDKLNLSLQEDKQNYVSSKERLTSITTALTSVEKEIESNKDAIDVISARLKEINTKFEDIEEGSGKLMEEKNTASGDAKRRQSEYDALKAKREELITENTNLQTRLAELKAGVESAKEDVLRMSAQMDEANAVITQNNDNISKDKEIVSELLKETEKIALSKDEQRALEDLRKELSDFEEKKRKLNDAVNKDNEKRQQLTDELNRLNEKKYAEENALTRVDAELDYLQERIFTEYQETYETCKDKQDQNYDYSTGAEEIDKLKKKISSLGSINANAIEDYEAQNAVYQEYMTQKADLDKAAEDINEAINALTDEMTETFDEGFSKIRENFKIIFKQLFGGGKADLVLDYTDCDDPLNAGVEILAEPPGKKLQKISLLSGGEMSLTAIAILFAILKLRPMPFCVLDEIEAALDDANVERFARYLKNFSEETQFIVITHKKVTMELSDALHGVTMEEKGVSKTVSVKFSDLVLSASAS